MSVELFKADMNTSFELGIEAGELLACVKIVGLVKSLYDGHVVTGRAKNGVMWRTRKAEGGLNDDGSAEQAPSITVTPGKGEAYCGSAVYYESYEEFGTRFRAPHAKWRPAIAMIMHGASQDEVLEKMKAEIEQDVKKNGLKHAKFY
jgi:phage gpG-like protein